MSLMSLLSHWQQTNYIDKTKLHNNTVCQWFEESCQLSLRHILPPRGSKQSWQHEITGLVSRRNDTCLLWWKQLKSDILCVCFFFSRWLRTGSMWPWWWTACSCGSLWLCVWWAPWAYFSSPSSRIPSLPSSSPAQICLVYDQQHLYTGGVQ